MHCSIIPAPCTVLHLHLTQIINRTGEQMDGLALQLPGYLYVETRDDNGVVTDVTYATDKLIAWSGNGCGESVGKLCEQICNSEIEAIDAHEEHQLLLLEEQWLELENGIDDEEEEAQYDIACDAVAGEARAQREDARQRRDQRHAAIDRLVLESMEHMANNSIGQTESTAGGYLLALAAFAGLTYVLLS